MPGIICSVVNPADADNETRWRHSLELVQHHPEHVVEQYAEPGFRIACVYHPEVCSNPRILVTDQCVLAYYGNIYEDAWASAPVGDAFLRLLLDEFLDRGTDALKHLNGRYHIAVWQRKARVLHIVSDRFGANRHYILQRPAALHIACEVKALVPFLDRIETDPAGLASMLAFGFHIGDLTILKKIKCLSNALHLVYDANNDHLSSNRYWNYPYGELESFREKESELAEALHSHLAAALKRSLRGIHKILLPISGGLDSRTVAGLLAQSGFTGEVLAYSYGQPSSRDVRYGRAIARRLGYRHVIIPTPANFITRHLEKAAWMFDAEWSAELNWAVRFGHVHENLGHIPGYCALSGMFGDLILGPFVGEYKQLAGNTPQSSEQLVQVFYECNQEYGALTEILALLKPQPAREAAERIRTIVSDTMTPLQGLPAFYALNRSEFLHRQKRHTGSVAQSAEMDLKVIAPFMDRNVVDFACRIPYNLHRGKLLYKHMIRDHLPKVASVPYTKTGLPLTRSPIRQALHWRADTILKHLPAISRHLARRNTNFAFDAGILDQKSFWETQAHLLDVLAPPLDREQALRRYRGILAGRLKPADQICAFLPPAIFIRELQNKIRSGTDAC